MILYDSMGHMVSDSSEKELHIFAKKIGLKQEWYQKGKHPHYDLTTNRMKSKAFLSGAYLVHPKELLRRVWWKKEE